MLTGSGHQRSQSEPGNRPYPAPILPGMENMLESLSLSRGNLGLMRGPDHHQLVQEMREHNFDSIRFSSYRTAVKLRFLQRKTHFHVIDIWNIIEAFRENGLNTLDPHMELNISRLESLVSSLYHNLNKRLPTGQHVHVDMYTSVMLNWLLAAYDHETVGKIRVFSVKVALATLCAGKLMDKLRYIFSQISDAHGHMVAARFCEYMREVLGLPAVVYESPSFHYTDSVVSNIFDGKAKVNVNDFLDTMMSDPGPQCLLWLPLMHRMATSETIVHPIACDGCRRSGFTGFLYRCQKCYNYQMCQDCFWQGKTNGGHTLEHEVKEYTNYSPNKQISHTLRKSFRCVPEKSKEQIPHFPEEPEKTLNLSHIVPPSPMPSHNGFPDVAYNSSWDVGSLDLGYCRSPSKGSTADGAHTDEEHRLIARYASRLAAENSGSNRSPSESSLDMTNSRAQRELIAQLDAKNREIMHEIAKLRRQQELGRSSGSDPVLVEELVTLRRRKEELETHLSSLQDSRRQLMVQLEGLMKMLKNHQSSPHSTPNSSPHSVKSPPMGSTSTCSYITSSRSAPPTPGSHQPHHAPASYHSSNSPYHTSASGSPYHGDSLSGVEGDVKMAFGSTGKVAGGGVYRNDLLVAADSVTNAMSSLVRELNSESSDQEDDSHIRKPLSENYEIDENESPIDSLDGNSIWRDDKRLEQESKFLAEIQARNIQNGDFRDGPFRQEGVGFHHMDADSPRDEEIEVYDNNPRMVSHLHIGLTDDESYARTDDDDSYIKTDDDEGGGTDWEESMRRWVNR